MLFAYWRLLRRIPAVRGRGNLQSWLALTLIAALAGPAAAQPTDSLTLAEAERLALAQEPGHEALLARSQALRARAVAAGQLLDPKARIGLMNYPIQSGGFSTEGMTQLQLGIRQEFPKGDSRALRTRVLQTRADALSASAGSRGRDVLAATRRAWLETFYWQRAAVIVGQSRPLFTDLVAISQALFSVGRQKQQDVLRAELELSRLDDRLLQIEARERVARGALGQWVGEASAMPLPASLPSWPELPRLATLQAQLLQHPAMRAAGAVTAASDQAVELAREQFKPGWGLDLGYGYRDGNLPSGEPRSDFISLMVNVDLPLFKRNRQSRELEAALQERRAAEHAGTQLRRRLMSELQQEYDRWQLLTQRIGVYEERILVQAQQRAEASLAAYQNDAGDISNVMRGFIDSLETQLESVRLQVERAQAHAQLANLGGLLP